MAPRHDALPFDGDGASIEWCVLVALVAVATSAYLDAWLGAALFVVALVYDLADVYVRFRVRARTGSNPPMPL